jgi:hypothetical protein
MTPLVQLETQRPETISSDGACLFHGACGSDVSYSHTLGPISRTAGHTDHVDGSRIGR